MPKGNKEWTDLFNEVEDFETDWPTMFWNEYQRRIERLVPIVRHHNRRNISARIKRVVNDLDVLPDLKTAVGFVSNDSAFVRLRP